MADNSIPTAYDPVVQLLEDAAGAVVVLTVTDRNSAGESSANDAVEFTAL